VTGAPAAARNAARRLPFAAVVGRTIARLGSTGAERIAARLAAMHELMRAADVVISPSWFLRERLAALGFAGIEVLPNGHEPLAVPPPRSNRSVRFGFLGALIPSKGVHVLAEAWRRLDDPRAMLEIHGTFAPYHGDSGYEARVRAMLGPQADACLRGPFPHERLGDVLGALDAIVVPSVWEENAPLVVEEAFLARRPLVVSDHGGLAERVREGIDGLRFRPGDPGDLARVLRRLLDEPELRRRLGADPPRVPTLDEHVRGLEALYEQAFRRMRERVGRVGVVVLDCGHPEGAAAAARSAQDTSVSPRVLVVENGPGEAPGGIDVLRLPENRGYAAGMNAGLAELRRAGCDRVLLLNNDATLEPGALRRLAEALQDPSMAAVGPLVLRARDGRVESQGARFDLRSGLQRLECHGTAPQEREGRLSVESLSGAAWMLSVAAYQRVGPLDEAYFHAFEDADWCARARAAGFELAVVLGARARHVGASTLGAASPDRLYYAARNHLRAVERLQPRSGPSSWLRCATILLRSLGHALVQGEIPRRAGLRAVLAGARDFRRGRLGARGSVS
jgi:GT2 family glycosyltransferase